VQERLHVKQSINYVLLAQDTWVFRCAHSYASGYTAVEETAFVPREPSPPVREYTFYPSKPQNNANPHLTTKRLSLLQIFSELPILSNDELSKASIS
jgi:hypothetical protein